mmetsp:Transcript_88366/g.250414  ORF Transcript_88366/g.250414 Transcript_88366/m.250414 type:complete len:215 (+) Transcript_88366:1154-1798(+)
MPVKRQFFEEPLLQAGELLDARVQHGPSWSAVNVVGRTVGDGVAVTILVHIYDHAHVLLLRPADHLCDPVQVRAGYHARLRLQQRPGDAEAHQVEPQLANLGEVVAAARSGALRELAGARLHTAERRIRVVRRVGRAPPLVQGCVHGQSVGRPPPLQGDVDASEKQLAAGLVGEHPPLSSLSARRPRHRDPAMLGNRPGGRAGAGEQGEQPRQG